MISQDCAVDVIALNHWIAERQPRRDYGPEVAKQIDSGDPESFLAAAEFINEQQYSGVIMQHEFGLLERQGREYVPFLKAISTKVVLVVHTPIHLPEDHQRDIVHAMSKLVSRVVVMSVHGLRQLQEGYNVTNGVYVPHGVIHSDVPTDREVLEAKMRLNLESRPLIMSFGLIHPLKRVDRMLGAMSHVTLRVPDALYVVAGSSHSDHGEGSLTAREDVLVVDAFLSEARLRDAVVAADVFVAPFEDYTPNSGSLLYAMSLAKPVVATPFRFATECLGEGDRGVVLRSFDDSEELGNAVVALLQDPGLRKSMGRKAHAFTRSHVWESVARAYLCQLMPSCHTDPLPDTHTRLPPPAPIRFVPDGEMDGAFSLLADCEVEVSVDVRGGRVVAAAASLAGDRVVVGDERSRLDVRVCGVDASRISSKDTLRITVSGRYDVAMTVGGGDGVTIDVAVLSPYVSPGGLIGRQLRRQLHIVRARDTVDAFRLAGGFNG